MSAPTQKSPHATLRITILGCGASGGVPRADGDWGACNPNDPRNVRTRCGLLLRQWIGEPASDADATIVLIDTPPELRQQLVAQAVGHLDAVVYSHAHADQLHGLDDVRPFALRQRRAIPVHADAETSDFLSSKFSYVVHGDRGYPAIMRLQPPLQPRQPFSIMGPGGAIALTPLLQDHGGIDSLGFRIADFAYSNDVVRLPEETLAALRDLDLWIVDALRYRPHPTHAHVAQALAWIERLRPKQAVLTNLHVDLDYAALAAQLPPHVRPAHDGLSFDLSYRCT